MYRFLLCGTLMVVVNCWSTLDKTDKLYTTHKLAESPDYNYYKVAGKTFKECNDNTPAFCAKYERKIGYQKFCDMKKVQTVCKRTCGRCPAVSPLSCHASQLGCCWDNITKVSSGCPDCKDRTPICRKIRNQCNQAHLARACPETCGICPSTCLDDPHQASFCPEWKEYGMCTGERELMARYCAKTCDLCVNEELIVEPVPEGKNEVVEVFRKGAESIFKQSESERMVSEKELIKLLLADRKERREMQQQDESISNEIPKATKKKELVADDILKIAKETNDVRSVKALEQKQQKKGLSEDSQAALMKVLSKDGSTINEAKKETKTAEKKGLSENSLAALMEVLNKDGNTKEVKKEATVAKKKGLSENSLAALMKVLNKNSKKEIKTLAKKESSNKALRALIELLNKKEVKKEASEDQTQQKKKADSSASLEELMKVLSKKEGNTEVAKIEMDNQVDSKKKRDASDKALFELIVKDEIEKEKKKEEAGVKDSFDDELFRIITQDKKKADENEKKDSINNDQTKKSIEKKILEILSKDGGKAVKKETKKYENVAVVRKEEHALDLLNSLVEEENNEQNKKRNIVDDALFDLLKERALEKEGEKKKKKETKEVDEAEILKKLFSKN